MSKRRGRYRPRDWAITARILERVIHEEAGHSAEVEVGRVTKLGGGSFRRAFIAWVQVEPDPKALSADYICLIPLVEDDTGEFAASLRREAALIRVLERLDLPFRVPRILAEVPVEGTVALVESAEQGVALLKKKGDWDSSPPWTVVGKVAAAIHSISEESFLELFPVARNWRQHAQQELAVFDGLREPVCQEARTWAEEHLPPETPGILLHGDLMPQNILIDIWDKGPPAVIDWSMAQVGDPAHDLAIAIRPGRKAFKRRDGLRLLLDAYEEAGGERLLPEAVQLHLLCIKARWYRSALQEGETGRTAHELREFKGLFQWICDR